MTDREEGPQGREAISQAHNRFTLLKHTAYLAARVSNSSREVTAYDLNQAIDASGTEFTAPDGYYISVTQVDIDRGEPTPVAYYHFPEVGQSRYAPRIADTTHQFVAQRMIVDPVNLQVWYVDGDERYCAKAEGHQFVDLWPNNDQGGGSAGDREPRVPVLPPGVLRVALEEPF